MCPHWCVQVHVAQHLRALAFDRIVACKRAPVEHASFSKGGKQQTGRTTRWSEGKSAPAEAVKSDVEGQEGGRSCYGHSPVRQGWQKKGKVEESKWPKRHLQRLKSEWIHT